MICWYDICKQNDIFVYELERDGIPLTRALNAELEVLCAGETCKNTFTEESRDQDEPMGQAVTPSPNGNKRRRRSDIEDSDSDVEKAFGGPLLDAAGSEDIWESGEARKLFNVPEGQQAKEFVRLTAHKLNLARYNFTTLKEFFRDGVHVKSLMQDSVMRTQKKCQHLAAVYQVAYEKYGCNKKAGDFNWHECCVEACNRLGRYSGSTGGAGYKVIVCPRTIQRWHRAFRIEQKIEVKEQKDRSSCPYFLENNRIEAQMIARYLRENISRFNPQALVEYIFSEDADALIIILQSPKKYGVAT